MKNLKIRKEIPANIVKNMRNRKIQVKAWRFSPVEVERLQQKALLVWVSLPLQYTRLVHSVHALLPKIQFYASLHSICKKCKHHYMIMSVQNNKSTADY